MTGGLLFDAAYRPDLVKVKAAGGIAMSVYLTGQYASTCASPAELRAAGLGALGNYEEGASELLTCGEAGGRTIGQRAASAAISKGFPANTGLGIAFSLDVNTPASKLAAVGSAFVGIAAGLAGRFVPLVYGEGAAIDYLWTNHRVLGVEWLAAPTSWPGYDAGDVHVGLVQQVGSPVAGTDEDKITNLDALAPLIWWPAGSPYAKEIEMLDPNDPVVQSLLAKENAVASVEQALAQIEIWGDATHPDSIHSIGQNVVALQAQVAALAAAVGKIQTAGIDVVALAQAIAAHVHLAAS